ncbi:type IV pilus modification protein PilV [Kingella kingae]|uniref:type IV pilus modification protein PilV n=1 Tax=Kingella kingae TaxID=504 RepID=UPI0004080F36|nr:type IV pilus modification protein PilV [Kingella kingae]MDK4625178.1 type IV pilus modification protein PilV [Kingella kingae]MDK4660871.1 type IV pilus modification protein PilV [Kingella kingae]MDK4668799.1 type IV pilus modification protein PilV [Kingella kingae]MDK4687192.1 type IV pilus modification protein PilV [Kingella kingae]
MKNMTYFHTKYSMKGATLLEVMISVLLLTFGILALMAAQLRSVASISEAENRSIVSQAAEALAEGMQMNAVLTKNGTTYRRRYSNYVPKSKPLYPGSAVIAPTFLNGTNITKAELAAQHLAEFEYVLSTQLPNVSVLAYAICLDKPDATPPVLGDGGALTDNCAPNNNEHNTNMIKIAWRMGNANGTDKNQQSTTYTYMLEVGN